jgi:hypothetical protein
MKKFLKKIIQSRKFWFTISAIVIPLIVKKMGVDVETATNIFWAFVALTGAQGLADLGEYSKK